MWFEKDSMFSRRQVVRGGLLAGIGAAVPEMLHAGQRQLPLIYKRIPSTGQKIPAVGLGTDELGMSDYETLRDIIKRLHQLGGSVIDTAARYGTSEVNIGRAIDELGLRDKMFVATKFNAPGVRAASDPPGGQVSIDRSFANLHKVDLMYIHFMESVVSMMPLLLDLKRQGKVRYIGLTVVTRPQELQQLAEYMRKYPIDVVQLAYGIGDRKVEAEVLPLAQERKIAVMAAHPLGRTSLMKELGGRQLPAWAADYDIHTWAQFFIKYVISHPAITCAIPGTANIGHLEDDLGAALGRLPGPAVRKRMEEFWDRKV